MQSENPANGAVLVIAQTAILNVSNAAISASRCHAGGLARGPPTDLTPEPRHGCDEVMGLVSREGLFVRNWVQKQERFEAPLLLPEVHFKALMSCC